jgi:sigma-B regulation protein RsbU (phosphoserine phosphatase)
VAQLDANNNKLQYCSAGHPPALLLRADGRMETLSEGGLLLGVLPNAPYVRGTVEMNPGDVLLAYSDGVLETLNNSGEEFGLERIKAHLRDSASNGQEIKKTSAAESMLFSVLGAVQDFAASHPLVDDLSLVVIRRGLLH